MGADYEVVNNIVEDGNVMHGGHTLVRRSKLFVPVKREKFVTKAWTRGADCIILDLEDAVAAPEKLLRGSRSKVPSSRSAKAAQKFRSA